MPKKVIIDTDPGIDDAMAILAAFNWDEVEVIGITTLFGNVPVDLATDNALVLRDLAAAHWPEAAYVPVCRGSSTNFKGDDKHTIADFVHGKDGFGNCGPGRSQGRADGRSAHRFIADTVMAHPGEVTILALASCTNVALAMQLEPSVVDAWEQLVILGGAFMGAGNVNPAAEANFAGDPEAADFVLAHGGAHTYIVGLDVTHKCLLSEAQLNAFRGRGRHGTFVADIAQFYLAYHHEYYGASAMFLHDPAALLAVVRKDLFTWADGAVVVATDGVLRGKSLVNKEKRKWYRENEWTLRPHMHVALDVQGDAVTSLFTDLITRA